MVNVGIECPQGSFTGAHTFQSSALEKGRDVPYHNILKALDQEDQLIMTMNRKLEWKKRGYNVSHSNESAEIDIEEMKLYESYKKKLLSFGNRCFQ